MPLKQSRSSFCCYSFTYSCAHNYLKVMYLHGTWVSQLTHPHLPCANTWGLWQQRQSLHQLTRCSSLPPSHFQPPGIVSLGVIYGAPGSASLAHRGNGTFGELVLLSGWIWCKGKMGGGPTWRFCWEEFCSIHSPPVQEQSDSLKCSLETPRDQEQRQHLWSLKQQGFATWK